jgi:tetratricopeptide (TPR) repeat protein
MASKYFFTITFLFTSTGIFSQRLIADSLSQLLKTETTDTGKVRLMWQMAEAMNKYSPDTALPIAQQALYLAKKTNYVECQSRSLGMLANSFMKIGNFPRALELNFQKLQLEEKRSVPRSLASVLMNIGIVYVNQEEYRKALKYYSKADSVIQKFDVKDFKYSIVLNIGDDYNRLDISDSAYVYFNKSLEIARELKDGDKIGKSLTGLGHSFLKLGSYQKSLNNYQMGIAYLRAANDDDVLCEASLGLANLYKQLNKPDSSGFYANQSLLIAKKDGFLSQELEAAEFLAEHYKETRNIDSAFAYLTYVHALNDSVNGKSRIRESQIISSNEQYRQAELEESRKHDKEVRSQQLQMLLIAMFIPVLFLITLLLSRVRLHVQAIRLLGVLSLLFFFEYLTLLLHPTVERLTHHTPVYEILIFVAIAAFLIPAHHKLEHWVIHKLIHHRTAHKENTKTNQASV